MYWLDLAIIYFALGAPFGVLRITAKRKVTPFAFFRMASGYLLWPLVAIRNVARFFIAEPAAQVAQKDELDAIRAELEKALFANAGASLDSAATRQDLYAFREVFYRYTGLAEAANAQRTVHNAKYKDIYSPLSILNSPLTRSACIARRDRQKLKSQLVQARNEFINLFPDSVAATKSVRILIQCLDDKTPAEFSLDTPNKRE